MIRSLYDLIEVTFRWLACTRGIPDSQVVSDVMLKPMPKGVFITFEELAGITAFLLSPAARNITGHTIDVDGGWTIQ